MKYFLSNNFQTTVRIKAPCTLIFLLFISDVAETVKAAGRTSIRHLTGKLCELVAKLLIITEHLTVLLFMTLHV